MKYVKGFFDEHGNPRVRFELCGIRPEPPGETFIGTLDTGFNGFVHAPLQLGFDLGLAMLGATSYSTANDATVPCFLAEGALTFVGETLRGVVLLDARSKDILLGTDFLRQFGLALVVSASSVALYDEKWLQNAIARGALGSPGSGTGSTTGSRTRTK